MRYLPLTKSNRAEMLETVGAASVDELYKDVPSSAIQKDFLPLPMQQSEMQVEKNLSAFANRNRAASSGPFFLGAGTYFHHIPASVDYIIQRSEFLTAYTPYQPEIAQGTLQVIFEFQTMIAQLTGQEIANASMYDGATATAEAALMAMRLTGRKNIVLGTALHPHYREVLESYLWNFDDAAIMETPDETVAAIIVQSPDFFGKPHAYEKFRQQCDAIGAKLIVVVTEIVSLGLLPPPVEADIVCGEAQSIGLPMSYGGPHLGFFACRNEFIRQMPGRLCGQTNDVDGRPGFVLTLSTREQHIRREKATSNICTNQGLCALAFTVHLSLLGEDGFKKLAQLNHERACALADALEKINGVKIETENFFNEFVISLPKKASDVLKTLQEENIIGGYEVADNKILACATDMTSDEDISTFAKTLGEVLA